MSQLNYESVMVSICSFFLSEKIGNRRSCQFDLRLGFKTSVVKVNPYLSKSGIVKLMVKFELETELQLKNKRLLLRLVYITPSVHEICVRNLSACTSMGQNVDVKIKFRFHLIIPYIK